MYCHIHSCPGEYEQRKIVHVVQRGEQLMLIDQVPAEVCSICGNVLFTQTGLGSPAPLGLSI